MVFIGVYGHMGIITSGQMDWVICGGMVWMDGVALEFGTDHIF